ncbi:MAG: hypothetical protein COB36_11035 [Alphaproteobacteria bacterium]|nr:MAG: hypothetical protein COB36_11035 [Alphaproteobacteria bacterium]
MYYKITGNKGQVRYVQAKSKAVGEVVATRLQKVKDMGRIKSFEHLKFERITPDDVMKVAVDAEE